MGGLGEILQADSVLESIMIMTKINIGKKAWRDRERI